MYIFPTIDVYIPDDRSYVRSFNDAFEEDPALAPPEPAPPPPTAASAILSHGSWFWELGFQAHCRVKHFFRELGFQAHFRVKHFSRELGFQAHCRVNHSNGRNTTKYNPSKTVQPFNRLDRTCQFNRELIHLKKKNLNYAFINDWTCDPLLDHKCSPIN